MEIEKLIKYLSQRQNVPVSGLDVLPEKQLLAEEIRAENFIKTLYKGKAIAFSKFYSIQQALKEQRKSLKKIKQELKRRGLK